MKKHVKFILSFLLLLTTTLTYCKIKTTNIFNTIDQLKSYAATNYEYPDIDNTNWLRPKYSSFYKKNIPSWTTKTLRFLRIQSPALWTAKKFKNLLSHVTRQRENNAYMGRFAQRIHPKPGSKFIVWGHLFGAFHSFVRGLDYLQKNKIIDKRLKIISKNHFIVFNGNAINMSPYILETLTVILKLMETNPQQILYIKGNHEDKEHWLNYGLKKELKIKASQLSTKKTPLRNLINRFFNTLPLALYLTANSEETLKAVRISFHDRNYEELNESTFTKLFENTNNADQRTFNLRQAKHSSKPNVDIDVVLKSVDNINFPVPPKGLASVDPDKGATSFVLFSSPIKSHRAAYNFFFDAFSVIDIKKEFDDWTISLFNQDVREKLGFTKQETYNLVSGNIITKKEKPDTPIKKKVKRLEKQLQACKTTLKKTKTKIKKASQKKATKIKKPKAIKKKKVKPIKKKKAKPVKKIKKKIKPKLPTKKTKVAPQKKKETPLPSDKKKLVIGTSQDLIGESHEYCKKVVRAMNATFKNLNKHGGINGKKIKLIVEDDDYKPKKTRQNILNFLKQDIDIIFNPFGGPTTQSYLDLIKKGTVLVLFPETGAPKLFNPNLKYILHAFPSTTAMSTIAVRYLIQNKRAKRIVITHPDSVASGNAKKIAAEKNKLDKKNYMIVSYRIGKTNFKKLGKKIREFEPDAIYLAGLVEPAVKTLKAIGAPNLSQTKILTTLESGEKFIRFIKENNLRENWINIEHTPNPTESTMPAMQDCRNVMKAAAIPISAEAAQAYIKAQIFIYLLGQVKGSITKKKIIDVAQNTKNANIKGFPISFNPKTRQLSSNIWVDDGGKSEWVKFPTM